MSPPAAARRRSGDPRKRAAAGEPPQPLVARRRLVAVALAAAVALVSLAAVSAQRDRSGAAGTGSQEDDTSVDARALMHAEVACDLTSKAGRAAEASDVGARARYAAAVLLLDQALVESARAAGSDTRLAALDTALRAVHTAGHEADHDTWQLALRSADAECRTVRG